MTEEKLNRNRVVSKTQYAQYLLEKATLESVGTICCLIGGVGLCIGSLGVVCLVILFVVFLRHVQSDEVQSIFCTLLACLAISGISYVIMVLGHRALRQSDHLLDVIPLTRHNADQLPPEDSLVRASAPPAQPHDVLLRAAQSDTMSPDELLRPG